MLKALIFTTSNIFNAIPIFMLKLTNLTGFNKPNYPLIPEFQ